MHTRRVRARRERNPYSGPVPRGDRGRAIGGALLVLDGFHDVHKVPQGSVEAIDEASQRSLCRSDHLGEKNFPPGERGEPDHLLVGKDATRYVPPLDAGELVIICELLDDLRGGHFVLRADRDGRRAFEQRSEAGNPSSSKLRLASVFLTTRNLMPFSRQALRSAEMSLTLRPVKSLRTIDLAPFRIVSRSLIFFVFAA